MKMRRFIKASPSESVGLQSHWCNYNIGTKKNPIRCEQKMYLHKPFDVEGFDIKTKKPYTKYFGYGFVCPNNDHVGSRVVVGY